MEKIAQELQIKLEQISKDFKEKFGEDIKASVIEEEIKTTIEWIKKRKANG